MIDIHSHILWGLDDGAESLDQTLAMLRLAAEHGTTDIVATPHANFEFRYQEDIVRERIAEASAAAGGTPRIHRGCDFHLSFDNVQDALARPSRYWVGGGPYLLVEFPDASIAGMGQALSVLLERGLVPVMTHPERQLQLREIPAEFQQWIQEGCLVQVTAQSLLGRFGKHAEDSAWQMIERGLAHFVASDAHDERDRVPCLDAAFAEVAKRAGEPLARRLFIENPRAVIAGERIEVERKKKTRRWNPFRP